MILLLELYLQISKKYVKNCWKFFVEHEIIFHLTHQRAFTSISFQEKFELMKIDTIFSKISLRLLFGGKRKIEKKRGLEHQNLAKDFFI